MLLHLLSGAMSATPSDISVQSRSPPQLIDIHRILDGVSYEPPSSPNSNALIYLLDPLHQIVFKAARHHPTSIAATAREHTIYALISSGLLKLPQSLRHYLSFPNHGTFMSYLPNVTLYARLRAESNPIQACSPRPSPSQVRQRLRWMLQLARLARAFARRDLDHGDWHPRNLMLDSSDRLAAISLSSVAQFGTRVWHVGSPSYQYHLSQAELNGMTTSMWSHDQSWWAAERRRWPRDVFPQEFGLDVLLNSYGDAERGNETFATERRACFNVACVLYFIMSGGVEPHPVMFEQARSRQGHEVPLSSKGREPMGRPMASVVLADPEDVCFEAFGLLGSLVRACWMGRLASMAVLAAVVREVSIRYCRNMGVDAAMTENVIGTDEDELPGADDEDEDWDRKKGLCEEYVLNWARAHQASMQGKM